MNTKTAVFGRVITGSSDIKLETVVGPLTETEYNHFFYWISLFLVSRLNYMHSKFFWCKIGMRNHLFHFFAEQQGSALWWEHSPPNNMFFRLLRSSLLSRRAGRVLRSMVPVCASWVNDNNKYSNLLLNESFFFLRG